MLKDWGKDIKLGMLVKLSQGQVINAQTNFLVVSEGLPLLRITDMINNKRTVFIDKDRVPKKNIALSEDIIYTRTGQVGLVFKNQFGVIHNNCFKVIPVDKSLDRNYLYWYLRSNSVYNYVNGIASGSAQPDLPHASFYSINIKLPPLQEQQRIASILSTYDDLLENNYKRIAILEKAAEQIYKEWFVRMRFPGYEIAEFEKGVPKGWLKELGNYIKVIKGKSYTGEEINDIGVGKPFVNLKSFNRGGGYRYDGIKYYTGKYHEKQVVREGDIVMAVTDMTQDRAVVGRVARIPKTEFQEMIISLDSAKIVPDKKLPNAFFYATLRFGFFGNTIKEFANGSNVLHLKPDLAYQMKSIIPDDEALIKKFDKLIEPYFNLVDNLNLENQNLKKTRDLLLPRLISGKLRVKDIPDPQKQSV
ncbi:MAG: restriction endonuclease subunit S [Saprospiraceae bacterium]|nr:restriction endonuclease subunit S [Saprospiraceae bacterium]